MNDFSWTTENKEVLLDFTSARSQALEGEISVPGDKSISHRAIMLGSIAEGVTTVSGFLFGEDNLATLAAFKAMDVKIEQTDRDIISIHGVGLHGLKKPNHPLDLGNSGTAMRLMAGLLAGAGVDVTLIGDESLTKRPMARVVLPLQQMGAAITMSAQNTAPLIIQPVAKLQGKHFALTVASAQVKSAILLAGIYAQGETTVTEPAITRDHTERMLQTFGYPLQASQQKVVLQGGQRLQATSLQIPSDISSAAFFMVAASIVPSSNLTIKTVGINPSRIGVINILKQMGADITIKNQTLLGKEPVADIQIKYRALTGITIPQEQVSLAIDEFPVLFIAAACAKGETILHGAKELRVKESDRIKTMVDGLQSIGIKAQAYDDGCRIQGGEITGGMINSHGDHRVAMAFTVAGLVANSPLVIQDCLNVGTSFPTFIDLTQLLGLKVKAMYEK